MITISRFIYIACKMCSMNLRNIKTSRQVICEVQPSCLVSYKIMNNDLIIYYFIFPDIF